MAALSLPTGAQPQMPLRSQPAPATSLRLLPINPSQSLKTHNYRHTVGTGTASDPDNDTLSYVITAGDEGKFAIDAVHGKIIVVAALDYEDKQSYSLTVQVSDGRGGFAIATVTITIGDVLDTPAPAPQSFSVTLSGANFSFTWDPVLGASEYRVQFHTGDDQWTDAVTGVSGTIATFPPDCGTAYVFRVQAYGDGTTYLPQWGADSDTQTGTTEACNQLPAFAQTGYDFAVSELAEVNSVVGIVSATDPDTGDTLSYSITEGNTDTTFSITSNGDGEGSIAVAAALNYDMTPSYTLTVAADDGRGGTATTVVRISLEQATCSSGKAVADPEVNPGLVGDCEVLLAAKETLEGNAELNWSAKRNITNWTGVRLSEVDPIRVVQLRLGNMGLSGSIPSGLSSLSKVTLLNLKENQMVGTIPTEIGTMSELEYLRLSDNQFSGEIPAELGNLSNLKVLLLRGNQLIGQIPSRLGDLADTLRTLLIADNDGLTGCIPRPLQDVSDNDFGDSHLSICTPPPTPTP